MSSAAGILVCAVPGMYTILVPPTLPPRLDIHMDTPAGVKTPVGEYLRLFLFMLGHTTTQG